MPFKRRGTVAFCPRTSQKGTVPDGFRDCFEEVYGADWETFRDNASWLDYTEFLLIPFASSC